MVKNFGHRGFSGNYPENTKLAFQKAIETPGCDGIEMDVHLTKDGELVIIHDELLDRTCVNMKGYVKDYTLDELKKADLSFRFAGQVEPQRIMTLREYLELLEPTRLITNIELKTGIFVYEGIEKKVLDLVREFDMVDRIIISSFNHYSVMRAKAICPEIKCGLLTESWILNPGKYVKNAGVECYHPIFYNNTKEIVEEIKKEGIEINTWTVNTETDIRAMISVGVDTIIGNFPDRITKIREEICNFGSTEPGV